MSSIEKVLGHAGVVVLFLDDESDYHQFWLVPMNAAELEKWWTDLDSFDSNPNGIKDDLYKVFGETPPPHKDPPVIPGVFVDAVSSDEDALWQSMFHDGQHYSCAMCCDSDSYLRRPDGSLIHHKGYRGDKA